MLNASYGVSALIYHNLTSHEGHVVISFNDDLHAIHWDIFARFTGTLDKTKSKISRGARLHKDKAYRQVLTTIEMLVLNQTFMNAFWAKLYKHWIPLLARYVLIVNKKSW